MGTNSFVNLPTVGVGYAATVLASTTSQLASYVTLGPLTEGGYQNGQIAFVANGPRGQAGIYVLMPAIGTADNIYLVSTLDDTSRQWILEPIASGGSMVAFEGPEVDLTQIQIAQITPSINKKYRPLQTSLWITASVAPTVTATLSAGNNSPSYNNQATSASPAGLISQAINTTVFLATAGLNAPVLDLSLGALFLNITVGATATTLKARLASIGQLFA